MRGILLSGLAALFLHAGLCQAAVPAKPNLILIIADDYGWKDLGCYGSDFYQTPNLDRLASEGVRFTQAYSACTVCSPSRAALMTGKYPARLHITDWIPGLPPDNPKLTVPDWTKYLPLDEITVANPLHTTGYASASIGKWHLGGEQYYPDKHGFDVNIAGTDASNPKSYFAPYNIATLSEGPTGEYLTDRLGDEALRFIETHKGDPFFLYFPHFAVHLPLQAKNETIEKYKARIRPGLKQTNAIYAAMIESMDDTVGRIRARLDELGLTERTIIIFGSDNGGRVPTTSNLPLRAGKGSCYEGGTRVPFIVYWPGVTKPGTVCDTPVIGNDILPTLLDMAGVTTQPVCDGRSLVPLLTGKGDFERDALFWHYPHYQLYQLGGTTPYGAVRAGDFKLIEFYDDMRVELYNLRDDIGEQRNLAAEMPAKADELRARLHAWRGVVGAQMPTPNPGYDPARPEFDPMARKRPVSLVPEKVPPMITDRQDRQIPDRVHLTGWVGMRVEANEANRLVKLDPGRLLEGYRHRPGRQTWDGEHVGKWLHAATLAWANTRDPELREKIDYVAAELPKCQLEDGYLGTYSPDKRWTDWDVWAHKYNLIGLITYMRYTGNLAPMQCCRRMADLLCNTFGDEPGKRDIIPVGNHIGMASTSVLEPMVLLYRMTGEPRYLDFCKYIMRAWEQPNGPKVLSTLLTARRVDKVANGKAYEMLSCVNGALEYYRTVGDPRILEAAINAWQDIVDNRLYVTGAASYRELFRGDFDFPNVNNVGETCVTVTWLQLNAHLLRLTGEARFAEQLEKVVLNQLFGAQCPDGSAWGYYVQMEGKKPYSGVLEGHCCLSSGPRGVALIPTFAVTTDADGVVVNLYDSGRAKLHLHDGTTVTLITDTLYPGDDQVSMSVQCARASFTVKLRVPEWCKDFVVQVNGNQVDARKGPDGYVAVRRIWKKGDKILVHLGLAPRLFVGDHMNENKLAVMYGPLVLAADETLMGRNDPGIANFRVAGDDLQSLDVRPEPATGPFKTWAGAHVFRVNGVVRKTTGTLAAGTSVPIEMVPFADAGITSGSYKVWLPYAEPRPDRNLLYGGVERRSRKPSRGSVIDGNPQTFASTKSGKPASEDWFSVEVTDPITIQRVVFYHGQSFQNGGWFDTSAGKPRLEIITRPGLDWQSVHTFSDYPATTDTDSGGLKAGERFECELPEPVDVYAVRVIGKPACGANPKQNFATCGELQAFGPGAKQTAVTP